MRVKVWASTDCPRGPEGAAGPCLVARGQIERHGREVILRLRELSGPIGGQPGDPTVAVPDGEGMGPGKIAVEIGVARRRRRVSCRRGKAGVRRLCQQGCRRGRRAGAGRLDLFGQGVDQIRPGQVAESLEPGFEVAVGGSVRRRRCQSHVTYRPNEAGITDLREIRFGRRRIALFRCREGGGIQLRIRGRKDRSGLSARWRGKARQGQCHEDDGGGGKSHHRDHV
jgi:hypothetical protein